MKFVRVGIFYHRNLKFLQVQSLSSCAFNNKAIDICKQKETNQSMRKLKFPRNLCENERKYSKSSCEPSVIPIVSYDEIKDLPNHPQKLLIDVREAQELIESGQIPTSINIPLGDVVQALSVISDDQFKKLYGKEKPTHNKYVIFHCRSGKRSENASELAVKLGFTNVKNYKGSWLDWAEHENLPQ